MTLGALLYLLMVGAIAIGALVVIGKIGALMIEGFILLIYHIGKRKITPTCFFVGVYYMLYLVLFGTRHSSGIVFDQGRS